MFTFTQRLLVVSTAAAALTITGTGGAYAYWSTTGSGQGAAVTRTMTVATESLTAGDAAPSKQLLPGRSADAVIKVRNPNAFSVTLVSVAGTTPPSADNGCSPTGVTFRDATGLRTGIAAGATTVVSLPSAVSMSPAAASACQGATFTIPVLIAVQR
ncbi:MAG: hypothetical protein QOC80_2256 [Frankiaceae bacterium]|nr:hypothetical protein [Frankiaceae bacterium]